MYYTLFALLHKFIYGEGAVLTQDMNLVLTLMATIGSVFVAALPFLIVFWIIRRLF